MTTQKLRYEISILIGPCTEDEAKAAMDVAHGSVIPILTADAQPGTTLKYWDEDREEPGDHVDGVEIRG